MFTNRGARHVSADTDSDATIGDGEQGSLVRAGGGSGRGARSPGRAAQAPLPTRPNGGGKQFRLIHISLENKLNLTALL